MNKRIQYPLSRREFLLTTGLTVVAGSTCGIVSTAGLSAKNSYEASFYDELDKEIIQCTLCPWSCVVPPGKTGKCNVRKNRNGKFYLLVYGQPCAIHNDPIEKKPFFHVYPGSKALSIATVGCNIECKFCQNWDISQAKPTDIKVPFRSPEEIVRMAKSNKSKTVAYTYSEPTIFYEYMMDCAKASKAIGIDNIMISNGFISAEPLEDLFSVMTAIKIDFKAFSQKFYGSVCGGRLRPVMSTLKRISKSDVWLEIVVLIIPTMNDNMDEIKRMSEWIVKELGPDIPLHFTRFHPAYKITNLPPTPIKTMLKARETAIKQGCNFVYTGNMPGGEGENTYCPNCKTCVINRYGNIVISKDIINGKCHKCSNVIPGVWG